jgi:hypothetical protein
LHCARIEGRSALSLSTLIVLVAGLFWLYHKVRLAETVTASLTTVIRFLLTLCCMAVGCAMPLAGQEVADTLFRPRVAAPAWPRGAGPLVLFDAAHGNGDLATGTYRPFIELLEHDGFRVATSTAIFTRGALAGDILVVINAQSPAKADDWSLPTPPALTAGEVETLREWVGAGGALLLVADHMPFPGATASLATEFGVAFMNGFAIDTVAWSPLVFRRADRTLRPHAITAGRNGDEHIDSVATFWGQAFQRIDERVEELLVFAPGVVSLNPDTAWRFSDRTPTVPVDGWLQGAALRFGAGRVVILGEAGMLSAQLTGERRVPVGMNARVASQNAQFTINVLRWLAGLLDDMQVPPHMAQACRGLDGHAVQRQQQPARRRPVRACGQPCPVPTTSLVPVQDEVHERRCGGIGHD